MYIGLFKKYIKLDSRLLCNAMGHPAWPKSIHYKKDLWDSGKSHLPA